MSKSKTENGHALVIDSGDFNSHLNTPYRFELEQWWEAIMCSI